MREIIIKKIEFMHRISKEEHFICYWRLFSIEYREYKKFIKNIFKTSGSMQNLGIGIILTLVKTAC